MELSTFTEFWDLVLVVWHEGLYGVDIAHILLALFIFLLFLTIRNLFTRYVLGAISRAVKKSPTENEVLDSLYAPLRFIPVVMGVFFATSVLRVEDGTALFLYNFNRSMVAFTIFWAFFCLASPLGKLLNNTGAALTEAMVEWIIKIAKIAFVVLGGATILELWGIAVGPIIAGLGLFGIALALGAQDLFKNLIAGFFVLGERRFHVGDWISVEGVVEGTVLQIGFRTTTVRRFDRAPVYVPNASLANNATTNFSRMSHRRIRWMLGVEYSTTLEQLKEIRESLEKYILESDEFANPEEAATFVRIDSFNDSSIDILVYCFTNTIVWGEWLEIKERLAYKIKEIVEGAGTGFAFPSRSLYIETPEDAPDVFPLSPPPEKSSAREKATQT